MNKQYLDSNLNEFEVIQSLNKMTHEWAKELIEYKHPVYEQYQEIIGAISLEYYERMRIPSEIYYNYGEV